MSLSIDQLTSATVINSGDFILIQQSGVDKKINAGIVRAHDHSGVYEPVISKLSGFNLATGTTAGTVATGDHTHSYEPALGNPSTTGYILSSTAAGVRSWIVPPSGGGGAATSLVGAAAPIYGTTGTIYSAAVQVREANGLGAQGSGAPHSAYQPRLAFHWSGVVASSITIENSGRIAITNQPGTAYENFAANTIYGATFQSTSARALKKDISDYVGSALSIINSTKIVNYKFIDDVTESQHIGFIADDTPAELATEKHDSLNIPDAIGVLLKAVQELTLEVETLKAKLGGN